jgi:hypothetical protein
MRGNDMGRPIRPDFRLSLNATDERVISVFGTAFLSTIRSFGVSTSKGRTLGPFGAGRGPPFKVDGLVLGFFGALRNGDLSGIEVWYTPGLASTFPTSAEMSAAPGNQLDVGPWDDGPT